MEKDVLFLLATPFEDGGKSWLCFECAMLEGALLANPHWAQEVDVRRIAFAKPRQEVIDLIGEENQWLPVLVRRDRRFLRNAPDIIADLARRFGGAGPHP